MINNLYFDTMLFFNYLTIYLKKYLNSQFKKIKNIIYNNYNGDS